MSSKFVCVCVCVCDLVGAFVFGLVCREFCWTPIFVPGGLLGVRQIPSRSQNLRSSGKFPPAPDIV